MARLPTRSICSLALVLALFAATAFAPRSAAEEAPPAAPPQPAADDAPAPEAPPAEDAASDAAPAPEVVVVRAAWAWLDAIGAHRAASSRANRDLFQAARTDEQKAAYRDAARKAYAAMRPLVESATDAFEQAFAEAPREALRGEEDRKLLERGLTLLAQEAMDHHPTEAQALWTELLEHVPDTRMADLVRTRYIPMAAMAGADREAAAATITGLKEQVEATFHPQLDMNLGDLAALHGDYEAAHGHYAAARAGIPADLAPRDPRKRLAGYLTLREELVGKPAPDLGSAHWLGAEATPLTDRRGQVVLLDFWATWCGPCIQVIPGLEAMHQELAGKGLAIVGVTREYKRRGSLPPKGDLPREPYTGETMEAFLAHLEAFRARMAVTYPFAVVDEDVMSEAYHVRGIPTLALVDPDGRIGYVQVGSGGHALLARAVHQRLARLGSDGGE